MAARRDEIQGLLEKARRDLKAACSLLDEEDILDIVCFHAQQAAEKALKALLLAHGVAYPYRHDLDELLELMPEAHDELLAMRDQITALTPFATAERYEDIARPAEEDAQAALAVATAVYEVARTVIGDLSTQ